MPPKTEASSLASRPSSGAFGRRSEKIDPNQLTLFEELFQEAKKAVEEESGAKDEEAEWKWERRRGRPHGRGPLPDHLPLYRQEQIFLRTGIHLRRRTLCDWMGEAAGLLEPIVLEVKRFILTSKVVQSDDTHVRVRMEDGRIDRGVIWAYAIPWAEVVYDFGLSRGKGTPAKFLEGYLLPGLPPGGWQRGLEKRQAEALPILKDLEGIIRDCGNHALPKSEFGGAVKYPLNQWPALLRYTEVGEAAIDNNIDRERHAAHPDPQGPRQATPPLATGLRGGRAMVSRGERARIGPQRAGIDQMGSAGRIGQWPSHLTSG